MAAPESYVQKLQHYCATNQIAQPQFQDYSDPRGIRTAWSSSVFVHGREYRAHLWRDYRYLEQSREEAAEVAWKALNTAPVATNGTNQAQYNYNRSYNCLSIAIMVASDETEQCLRRIRGIRGYTPDTG